jgi:hypothetical protein
MGEMQMKSILAAMLLGLVLALSGCGAKDGGQQRGLFTGAVTDKAPEEVEGKFGKPASIETPSANTLKWTYKRITFDPDNQNIVDNETILIFQKGADGKFKVTQVIFG